MHTQKAFSSSQRDQEGSDQRGEFSGGDKESGKLHLKAVAGWRPGEGAAEEMNMINSVKAKLEE